MSKMNELYQDIKQRGTRLKTLRMMTRMSRSEFQGKHGISASTMQSWEDGKAGGIKEKGAARCIQAFRKEGINVTTDWLLEGRGVAPRCDLFPKKEIENELRKGQLYEDADGLRYFILSTNKYNPNTTNLGQLMDDKLITVLKLDENQSEVRAINVYPFYIKKWMKLIGEYDDFCLKLVVSRAKQKA